MRAALSSCCCRATVAAQTPARAAVIAAATDIIQKAHYCTFITIDEDGQPQARMVDPIAPDADFTIWFATNPLTRKVDQVRRNPKVTLSCFDAATSSYVTVLGRGDLVTDVTEKQRHWKTDWAAIYPERRQGQRFHADSDHAGAPRDRQRVARHDRRPEDLVAAAIDFPTSIDKPSDSPGAASGDPWASMRLRAASSPRSITSTCPRSWIGSRRMPRSFTRPQRHLGRSRRVSKASRRSSGPFRSSSTRFAQRRTGPARRIRICSRAIC